MGLKEYHESLAQLKICAQPIFIVGCPRSGTTGLAHALGRHSQLWTLGESGILYPLFHQDPVTAAVESFKSRLIPNWLATHGVEAAEVLAYAGLGFNALFTSKNPTRRWIDKTPQYLLMADTLAAMFPDALFLHLVRDGRRVVHSMIHYLDRFPKERQGSLFKTGQPPAWSTGFEQACSTWNRYVGLGMAFAARHPERCLTVINEQLVAEPREGFAAIFQFIQVPEERTPVQFYQTFRINSSFPEKAPELAPAADASAPVGPRRDNPLSFVEWERYQDQQSWKDWTPEQKQVFAREAGDRLVQCGFAAAEELADWKTA
jgi:hypothetical protein